MNEPVSEDEIEAWLQEVKARIVARLQREGWPDLKVSDFHLTRTRPPTTG